MNEDEKETIPVARGGPSASAAPALEDDSAWDETGGATLVTGGPTFDLPSDIPSPVTVPPPGPAGSAPAKLPPMRQAMGTLAGLMPEDLRPPLPLAAPPPRSAPVAAPRPPPDPSAGPRRASMPSAGFVPPASAMFDDDAVTEHGPENPSRALSSTGAMPHRDVQVVVGEGVTGDEPTIAGTPGELELLLGRGPLPVRPPSDPHGWGPPPEGPTSFGPAISQHGAMGPPSTHRSPAPQPASIGAVRPAINAQTLLVVGVGVVCLAVFVMGIVMFVTARLH